MQTPGHRCLHCMAFFVVVALTNNTSLSRRHTAAWNLGELLAGPLWCRGLERDSWHRCVLPGLQVAVGSVE